MLHTHSYNHARRPAPHHAHAADRRTSQRLSPTLSRRELRAIIAEQLG